MSGEVVDDPMEVTAAAYDMDVGEPNVEGTESQQLEDMIILDDRGATPVPEVIKNFRGNAKQTVEKEIREENIDDYDLIVTKPAVDIETLSASYTSLAFVLRIDFLLQHCPCLRQEAMVALINYLKSDSENLTRYTSLFKELDDDIKANGTKPNVVRPTFDSKWADDISVVLSTRLDALQSEYKRQKDEGVKESTRRAMEDLFQHYCRAGQIDEALRLYARGIRDYCTQLKHSINMFTNWIELSIYAGEWVKVDSMSQQALRTLKDAEEAEKVNHGHGRIDNPTYMIDRDTNIQANTLQNNRNLIDSALAQVLAVQAIVKLRQKKYSQVAEKIFEIKLDHLQPKWFVTYCDLGIYAMLCCMATYERNVLKQKITEEGTFRKLLECEPIFFEILQSYSTSQFGKCFEMLNSVQDRLLLDPFISQCVNDLYTKIRQKCIIQYLKSYSSIKLNTMSQALGFSKEEIEEIVVELIENNEVSFRIDQLKGVLRIVDNSDEKATHRKVIDVCQETFHKTNLVLWKSVLAQGNIVAHHDKEIRGKRKTGKEKSGGYLLDNKLGQKITSEDIRVNNFEAAANQQNENNTETDNQMMDEAKNR